MKKFAKYSDTPTSTRKNTNQNVFVNQEAALEVAHTTVPKQYRVCTCFLEDQ